MKKSNLNINEKSKGKTPLSAFTGFKFAIVILAILIGSGCKQSDQQISPDESSAGKHAPAKISGPQPLPAGRTYFSVTLGNFDNVGSVWNRIINWTFNGTNGTVSATAYTWESTNKQGKAILPGSSHTCTFDGETNTCNAYTPYGWGAPSGQYVSWAGTYTYVGTTLTITWTTIGGNPTSATDTWTVTDIPAWGVARVALVSSNYTLTHGRGYGSTSPWSVFKTITTTPRVNYASPYSKHVVASGSTGNPNVISPASGWSGAGMGIAGFTTPSSGANVLHAKNPTTACATTAPPCATTSRSGIVFHMASTNTNRAVSWTNFCACLTTSTFPCYTGNLHPSALMQIINDSGDLVGYVGIEAQNPPEASYNGAFQFQLMDFTNIP